jgi:hypothetical protein
MDIFNLKEINIDQMVVDHNDLVKKYIALEEKYNELSKLVELYKGEFNGH